MNVIKLIYDDKRSLFVFVFRCTIRDPAGTFFCYPNITSYGTPLDQ